MQWVRKYTVLTLNPGQSTRTEFFLYVCWFTCRCSNIVPILQSRGTRRFSSHELPRSSYFFTATSTADGPGRGTGEGYLQKDREMYVWTTLPIAKITPERNVSRSIGGMVMGEKDLSNRSKDMSQWQFVHHKSHMRRPEVMSSPPRINFSKFMKTNAQISHPF
jgi:hypothetical protein